MNDRMQIEISDVIEPRAATTTSWLGTAHHRLIFDTTGSSTYYRSNYRHTVVAP
ncbi:uncharacterized protein RAG0_15237 [Rhynchosporium agropyri]|uniref:Uncharacterized protein n=1 Tax=Rhynchosporium agropyri TaxID=914238 RepID=A0A1E1LKA9_9HELO|nr:uncharacterized protein RAG0_15237 [Rhynchosporium agropyri]